MTLSEYIEFLKNSWDYMKGSRKDFWFGLPRATMKFRRIKIKEKKELNENR